MKTKYPYKKIALGGTFDRLHKGHKYFLQQAFEYGRKVVIGLTSDLFVTQKIKNQKSKIKTKVINYKERKKELESFLREKKLLQRAEIVKIDDVYGPAATDDKIEALMITVDSYKGGWQVNKKRKKLGRKPLQLIRISLQKADDGKAIASTRIRLGEINRLGKVYMQIPAWGKLINQKLRQELKIPIGYFAVNNFSEVSKIKETIKQYIKQNNPLILITVGDEVTKLFNEINIKPDIAIVDFIVQRKPTYTNFSQLGLRNFDYGPIWNVKNQSGSISKPLVSAICRSLQKWCRTGECSIIKVDGEEDLAGLPAILLAPLGSLIVYGQPHEGVVLVAVTEDMKSRLLNMII